MATKAFKSEKIDALKAKIEKAQVAIVTEYKGYTAFVVNDSFGRNNKGYYIKRKDHIVCGLKWIDEFGNKLFTELAIKKAIYSALLQLLRV